MSAADPLQQESGDLRLPVELALRYPQLLLGLRANVSQVKTANGARQTRPKMPWRYQDKLAYNIIYRVTQDK